MDAIRGDPFQHREKPRAAPRRRGDRSRSRRSSPLHARLHYAIEEVQLTVPVLRYIDMVSMHHAAYIHVHVLKDPIGTGRIL